MRFSDWRHARAEWLKSSIDASAKIAMLKDEFDLATVRIRAEQFYGLKKLRYGDPVLEGRSRPTRTAPAKCPCCGSREFRQHQWRTICSFCRSGQ